jgi:signal transduction histidine kinase
MKTRARPLLVLLVALPVLLLSLLAWRVAQKERSALREQYKELLEERLGSYQGAAQKYMIDVSEMLKPKLEILPFSPSAARDFLRKSAHVSGILLIDSQGGVLYPSGQANQLSREELAFLERTKSLRETRALQFSQTTENRSPYVSSMHWFPFYSPKGLRLIGFLRDSQGVRAAELNPSAFVSGLIAALHNTDVKTNAVEETVVLRSSHGEIIASIGETEVSPEDKPTVSLALGYPLGSLTLELHSSSLSSLEGVGASTTFNFVAAIVSCIGLIVFLGIMAIRENAKVQHEAQTRVSFVNQVSHEFKTPLTNIRMYAEMLAERLDEQDPQSSDYANIVVDESRRLSRLINNVLSFGSRERGALSFSPRQGVIEKLLEDIVEQFRPSLEEKGIRVELDLAESKQCYFDADLVTQVVSNLISNVEKYASGGEFLGIKFRKLGEMAEVLVIDRGPGIANAHKNKVFDAFYRASDSATEGVSGAGIGLTLSRTLAELHGGSLSLDSSEYGAVFKFTFSAPEEEGK